MNVQVLRALDRAQHAALLRLLDESEAVDAHPALADPQRAAAARADLGDEGNQVVLAFDDGSDAGGGGVGGGGAGGGGGGGGLLACAFLSFDPDGATAVHLVVHPDSRGGDKGAAIRNALMTAALDASTGNARLWFMRATADDDRIALGAGFVPERELLQMRVALPLSDDVIAKTRPVTTRAFAPGKDDEAWLSVNNRAFVGHPEQGGWTLERLHERMSASWFDAEGFRVVDAPDGTSLVGSCWTKVHRHATTLLGEIYVIAVDPDHHGEGWGRALTVAGLQWLTEHGIPVGMLYTDAANIPAVALYRSLGFSVDHVDRSYLFDRP